MRAYSRAQDKETVNRDWASQANSSPWWYDWEDYIDYDLDWRTQGITLESVRQGWLVNLLTLLGVRSAKDQLENINW